MVNRWCQAGQVRPLVGEQRGLAGGVERGQQAAGHHDPAGRAGQRVRLDGVPGHDDDGLGGLPRPGDDGQGGDGPAGRHQGGPPVRLGQAPGAGADHHRDRHRDRRQQQGRGHPGQDGNRVAAAEHGLGVAAHRGQRRHPGQRRRGQQGQRGRAEGGQRDRGHGQQPGGQARFQPRRQRPGGHRGQHGHQQRQIDERVHRLVPGFAEQLAQQPGIAAGQLGHEPAQHRAAIRRPAGPGSSGWRPGWRRRPAGRRRRARPARARAGPWRAAGTRSSRPCCRTGPRPAARAPGRGSAGRARPGARPALRLRARRAGAGAHPGPCPRSPRRRRACPWRGRRHPFRAPLPVASHLQVS